MKLITHILICLIVLHLAITAQGQTAASVPDEVQQAIHELQTNKDSNARAQAARRLGELKQVEAAPALIDALLNDEAFIGGECAAALQQLGDPRALPALRQALNREKSALGGYPQAIDALVALHDPQLTADLLGIACRADLLPEGRLAALRELAKLHDPSIDKQLLPLLHCNDDNRAILAARAALFFAGRGMHQAVPDILPLLHYRNPLCRKSAAQALGQLKDPAAIPALSEAVVDEEAAVRLAAVEALAAYRRPALLSSLLPALRDPDARVRACGAAAIGACGNAQAVSPLLRALHDEDACAREAAAEALGKYAPLARKSLLVLLADRSASLRAAAAQALGAGGCTEAAPRLVQLLSDSDPEVRYAATTALSRLGKAGVTALLPLLKSGTPALRARAAQTLGDLRAASAIPALEALARDPEPEVRVWGVAALAAMPDPPLEGIVNGMQDPDPAVRVEAIRAAGTRHLRLLAPLLLRALIDDKPPVRAAAHSALCALAGQDLGTSSKVWEEWEHEQK